MVPFQLFNATLWNIVMAINEVEKHSCSLQIVHNVYNESWTFSGPSNQFLKASIETMIRNAIPVILTDYLKRDVWTWDIEDAQRMPNAAFNLFIVFKLVPDISTHSINFSIDIFTAIKFM